MEGSEYLSQFLYLLVYSSSLISAAAIVMFRKRLNSGTNRTVRQITFSIAVSTTLLSVQVFLNAVGLLEHLNEADASRAVLLLNTLIIAGTAGLVYSSVSVSFALRPAESSRIVLRITAAVVLAMLAAEIVLQILILFLHSLPASELFGIIMISGLAGFSIGIIFASVRLFIPLNLKKDPGGLAALRLLLLLLFTFPALFFISGSTIGTILAPTGFIALNILCIRILFIRLNTSQPPADAEAGTKVSDPAAACRDLGLSKRESDVALLLSQGLSYKEISAALFISMSTTQTHVGRIYSKLRINNKTELSNLLNYRET